MSDGVANSKKLQLHDYDISSTYSWSYGRKMVAEMSKVSKSGLYPMERTQIIELTS